MSLDFFQSPKKWMECGRVLRCQGMSIGFVPTMGALHAGHLSLVERAKKENDKVLVSIFVNPTQFNDNNDFAQYPKNIEADLEFLKEAGVDYVLSPSVEDLYPDGFKYRVSEDQDSKILEGAHRPGHFVGMLSVVMKLLNISNSSRAYFGEKDYQQLELIRGMVKSFFMDVQIVGCPTVRTAEGLALSSRNSRLGEEDFSRAKLFAKILRENPNSALARSALLKEGFEVDYVEDWLGRRLAAVKIGEVRLIDNQSNPESFV